MPTEKNDPPPEPGKDYREYIEFPSIGETYRRDEFGVYAYGNYLPGDVNFMSGQPRREFLNAYETLEEARENFPGAIFRDGTGYVAWDLPHTPPASFDPEYAGESWDDDDDSGR